MRYYKILIFFALLVLTACTKDKETERITEQERIIDRYWESLEIDSTNIFEKTVVEDIYRIVLTQGDTTQTISAGDSIFFYYTGAILTNAGLQEANIFVTNIRDVAEQLGLAISAELDTCKDVAGAGHFISGLEKGLLLMHKGEKAQIIFTSKYGYGDKVMNIIPSYSPIIFEINMIDVKKQ